MRRGHAPRAASSRRRARRRACQRGGRPRHGPALDQCEIDDVVRVVTRRRRLGGQPAAEDDGGDRRRREPVARRLRPPHLDVGRGRGRRLREHHADRERRGLVVDDTEGEQSLGEIGGRRMRADLPGEPRTPAPAEDLVDLRANFVHLPLLQAETLCNVPRGLVAASHPQHVAVVRDSNVLRAERRVRVRVLGELDQPVVVHGTRDPCPMHRGRRSSDARRASRTRASPRTGPTRRSHATCRRFPGRHCRPPARALRCRTSRRDSSDTTRRSGC